MYVLPPRAGAPLLLFLWRWLVDDPVEGVADGYLAEEDAAVQAEGEPVDRPVPVLEWAWEQPLETSRERDWIEAAVTLCELAALLPDSSHKSIRDFQIHLHLLLTFDSLFLNLVELLHIGSDRRAPNLTHLAEVLFGQNIELSELSARLPVELFAKITSELPLGGVALHLVASHEVGERRAIDSGCGG